MHKLFLIEKYSPCCSFWKNLIKGNKIEGMSVEEVIKKYQGFEGKLLTYFSLEKNEYLSKNELEECLEYQRVLNCIFLHLLSGNSKMTDFYQHTVFMGYDVGICEDDETSVYSSIFNEVLFGNINELISYKEKLNENFLFQDRPRAEEYVDEHNKLSECGRDVEDYFEMNIYEVWKQLG